jgi:DNA-binding MarR family transcriptional regulator
VAQRLHSAAIHLLRRLRTTDDAMGLSAPAASALSVLVFAGSKRLTDLARLEQVRPPSMTRLVAALERSGLVEREADPSDRRVQRVDATTKGRRILEEGRARRVASLAAALRKLPGADLAALERAVAILERVVRSPTS